jgi:histidyl-tRNA synthetase
MGKYGEEGDKLLFKVLNSGNFLQNVPAELLSENKILPLTNRISEKGLRYDLTVPFARYVVQHRNDIVFPFKRYQIQPVWRADRPQRGRYREFFQCDADIIGSASLLNEVELLQIIDSVFAKLGIEVIIKLNNRKILGGIAAIMGQSDRLTDITVAIDKIEKTGLDAVKEELRSKNITDEQLQILEPVLCLTGTNNEKLNRIEEILSASETGLAGIAEIRTVFSYIDKLNIAASVELDLSLARGLNYYTGAIIEVKAKNADMGSICGGGRYDNLTGIFGLKNVSGAGISFGADRIYDVLSSKNLFPQNSLETTRVLFVNMGEQEAMYCLPALQAVRNKGVSAEIYPEQTRLKKQLEYADKKNIPFVVIVGEEERASEKFLLKKMCDKSQKELTLQQFLDEKYN